MRTPMKTTLLDILFRLILAGILLVTLSGCNLQDLLSMLQEGQATPFEISRARWDSDTQRLDLQGTGLDQTQPLLVLDADRESLLAEQSPRIENEHWELIVAPLAPPPCRVRVETEDGRSDTRLVEGAQTACHPQSLPPDNGGGTGGTLPPATGGNVELPGPVQQGRVKVFAFNDLGMHCMDEDSSVFTLLPPFNTLHAQAVQIGRIPRLLSNNEVQIIYRATADPSGSVNSTSIGKTDFWDQVGTLFGVTPPPDTGLTGSKMPSTANGPQPFGQFDAQRHRFIAEGIPLTPIDDSGRYNPYPLFRVEARDAASGALHSDLDVVVPVSTEMNCSDCHHGGGRAADSATAARYGISGWSQATDPVVQYKENILILHDAKHGTRLPKPVLCASCHYSAALDLEGKGPQNNLPFLSRAIHGRHGRTLDRSMPSPGNPAIIPDTGNLETCYNCHPGKQTQCFRGVMFATGLSCQNCHGNLLTVAGTAPRTDGSRRRPWIDLPRCGACHTGEATVRRLAYDPNDPTATPLSPANDRFAENPSTLYRNSSGHGGMACAACHGSPHAIWPVSDPDANDHLTPRELQGHSGTIVECTVCHEGGAPVSLDGPHGLHPVGAGPWLDRHGGFFERDPASCRSCHGSRLEGSRLAKVAVDRVLPVDEDGVRSITLRAGQEVSCNLCHETPH